VLRLGHRAAASGRAPGCAGASDSAHAGPVSMQQARLLDALLRRPAGAAGGRLVLYSTCSVFRSRRRTSSVETFVARHTDAQARLLPSPGRHLIRRFRTAGSRPWPDHGGEQRRFPLRPRWRSSLALACCWCGPLGPAVAWAAAGCTGGAPAEGAAQVAELQLERSTDGRAAAERRCQVRAARRPGGRRTGSRAFPVILAAEADAAARTLVLEPPEGRQRACATWRRPSSAADAALAAERGAAGRWAPSGAGGMALAQTFDTAGRGAGRHAAACISRWRIGEAADLERRPAPTWWSSVFGWMPISFRARCRSAPWGGRLEPLRHASRTLPAEAAR
jgi:hypothetical protein